MGKKKVIQKGAGEAGAKRTSEAVRGGPVAAKKSRKLTSGRIYINSSYNNTVITVTDPRGDVVTWASAGSLGFSGPKKATPFASQKIVEVIAERLRASGPTQVEIIAKGVGSGRDAAIRSLVGQGFDVVAIKDVTPIPHNGPRPPKPRRV